MKASTFEPRPDMHLSVVIPAFNESQRLPNTLTDVLAYLARQTYLAEVLVVDDGSSDDTARLVREWSPTAIPLRLLAAPDGRNHGKGAAVRRGLGAASGRYRLFMDADNTTTLDQVERFWPCVEAGCDVVIGSRHMVGANALARQPWYKALGGKLGNFIIRRLALGGIADTQAGFKLFSCGCLEDILPRLTIDRWGFDVEMLVAARRRGYRVQEVPVVWRNASLSKVQAMAYLEVLGEVWRVRRQSSLGWYD